MAVRVLQVLTCDAPGGTEHMVAALVERADRKVIHQEVVTLAPRGPIAVRLDESGARVRSLGGRGLAVAFARLAVILARERFDVVNAYGFKSTAVTRILVRLLARQSTFVNGVRGLHVSELERIDGPKSRFVLAVERLLSPLVDIYDANSPGALELLRDAGIRNAQMRYVPNGIDIERWQVGGRNGTAVPTVLCVARFVPRKRHVDLIEAACRLRDAGVSFRLILVGGGPTLREVQKLVAQAGIEPYVEFAGSVGPDAVRRLLQDATVFCLPSLWEGMAGSVMEAMASGLPVVGTDVNGIAELVDEPRTGYLVAPERPQQLADALATVLSSRERARAMGDAGRRRIGSEFSVEGMVLAKQELYVSAARDR